MAVLSDHHHLMIGSEGNDIDPVVRFNGVEVMFDSGAGREDGIRSYGEDTIGLFGSGSNLRPRLDHDRAPLEFNINSIGEEQICQTRRGLVFFLDNRFVNWY